MGYGLGVFLLAIGLILALAVRDSIDAIDVTLVGWILAGCGVLVIVLQALQANRRGRRRAWPRPPTRTAPRPRPRSATRSTRRPPPDLCLVSQ
jgi:hypothetical protein